MKSISLVALIGLALFTAQIARAQEEPFQSTAEPPAAGDELSVEQARLADRFKRLEQVLGQLAELSASTDPRRARLLREAIARSREQDINVRFESVVKLLEEERLSAAANNQLELHHELDGLLTLLLKADRDKELASQRDRVRKYLKQIAGLIRMQKGIRARTEGGDELRGLSEDQQRVAKETGELGGDISQNERKQPTEGDANAAEQEKPSDGETPKPSDGQGSKPGDPSKPGESSKSGKPSEGDSSESSKSKPGQGEPSEADSSQPGDSAPSDSNPSQGQGQPGQPSQGDPGSGESSPAPQEPTDRAAERLRRAAQQMEDARKKLEDAQRKDATERQREALRELEQAKAELERVLRQLREEELERTLTQLAARCRRMLELQNQVYEGTVRLNEVPQADRDHDDEIESARLSRQESDIVHEADKALLLLREEGSSVAFPEVMEQMRDDMRQVVERLAKLKVGELTQGLEQDIIAALEEMIAALEQARKDLEKKRTPPGQQPAAGQPTEPDLVDALAELKLIRSLQMRIYQRTQRYGAMIEGEQADTEVLLEALRELAERQERVFKATSDLEEQRNQ